MQRVFAGGGGRDSKQRQQQLGGERKVESDREKARRKDRVSHKEECAHFVFTRSQLNHDHGEGGWMWRKCQSSSWVHSYSPELKQQLMLLSLLSAGEKKSTLIGIGPVKKGALIPINYLPNLLDKKSFKQE